MAKNGYRLKVTDLGDLSRVLDDFRKDALRILANNYGRLVAIEAVKRLDLHTLQVPLRVSFGGKGPIQDANLAVRQAFRSGGTSLNPDQGCELQLHLNGNAVLVRFENGDDEYRRVWEKRPEVIRWDWAEDMPQPRNVSDAAWSKRERLWKATEARPGLVTGLRFSLLDVTPPVIGWTGVRKHVPTIDERMKEVLKVVPGINEREMASKLRRDVTKEVLLSYPKRGVVKRKPKAKPVPAGKASSKSAQTEDKKSLIDHADIVQASDGRVFMAVHYVGLSIDDRVFVQIGDNHIAITQNATQFGYVTDVPRAGADLLRECKSVTLVEVENKEGRRLLRAKHVAIVQDVSLSDNVTRSLGRWRSRGQNRNDGEIRTWDSEPSKTQQ